MSLSLLAGDLRTNLARTRRPYLHHYCLRDGSCQEGTQSFLRRHDHRDQGKKMRLKKKVSSQLFGGQTRLVSMSLNSAPTGWSSCYRLPRSAHAIPLDSLHSGRVAKVYHAKDLVYHQTQPSTLWMRRTDYTCSLRRVGIAFRSRGIGGGCLAGCGLDGG